MSSRRRFGWRDDPALDAFEPIQTHLKLVKSWPVGEASILKYRGPRIWQGPAGSCLAMTQARLIHASHLAAGHVAPFPSARQLYFNGRRQEYAGVDPNTLAPPVDRGMFLSKALLATRRLGFCPWDSDPYGAPIATHSASNAYRVYDLVDTKRWGKVRRVNLKPPLSSHSEAYDQKGLQWFVLPRYERSRALTESIRAGVMCGVAFTVGKPFLDVRSSDPVTHEHLREPQGGHALAVLEVLANGDVVVDNWWEDWGYEDGFAILDRSLVESDEVKSFGILPAPPYKVS
jgi:hypothetical protein